MSYLVKYEDGYHLFQEGNGDEPPRDLGLFDPTGGVAPPTGFRSTEQTEGIAGIGGYGIDGRQALDMPSWATGMTPVWQNADKWGYLQNGVLSDYWTDGQYIYANPGTGSRYGAPAGVYDPAVGANRIAPLSQAQALNQTLISNNPGGSGGDFITKFLDAGGGVAALMALTGIGAATGFGGALGAGVGGEAGLAGIYNTGAGGFGAPLSAYESALPISAGIDAGAAGLTGSLTGMGGLTPLADAAAAGAPNSFTSSLGGVNGAGSGIGGGGGGLGDLFSNIANSPWNEAEGAVNINTGNLVNPTGPTMPYESPIPTASGNLPTSLPSGTQPPAPVQNGPTNPSTGPNGSVPGSANQSSAIQRILSGQGTMQDWLQLGGSLGGSILGALGNDAQRSAQNDVADKYLALGAPYRGLLAQSYQPGFTMMNEPGYRDAIDASTNSFLRAASAGNAPGVSGGNPMDNPGAWAETQKYVTANTALPQLNTYRSQLGSFGQLGTNTAGAANLSAAATAGGAYNAAGYGLGQITNPSSSIDDLLRRFQQMSLPSSNTSVNTGFTF